jgi:hypothetical protein
MIEFESEEIRAYDGTGEEAESTGFVINDDRTADWAVEKVKAERAECDRLKALGQAKIDDINAQIKAAEHKYENRTSYLTQQLEAYFNGVSGKKVTKTAEKYTLLSGTLERKKGGVKYEFDNDSFTAWLSNHKLDDYIKKTLTPKWGEFKPLTELNSDGKVVYGGQVLDGVTATPQPDKFEIK